MDTLSGSIIGAEPALSAYRWNSLSPSTLSDNDDDDGFCRPIKTERRYELDDDFGFGAVSESPPIIKQPTSSSCTTIPLASCATAAASLSSAFCKRPNAFTKPQAQITCDRSFSNGLTNSSSISNLKTEQTEGSQSSYTTNQSSFMSMSPTDCSLTEDVVFPNVATGNGYNDAAQMDIYRDLILRHLIQDISTTCTKLGLPTNPYTWTAEHSGRWMSDMCMQFQLPPPRQLFLSGRVLLSMSQEEFLARAPEGGDTLHAQLQLWKTAFESYTQQGSNSNQTSTSQSQSSVASNNNNWLTSQAQATSRNAERITSAQDYLNSFNPSTADVAPAINYYSSANNNYQSSHQENGVSGGRSQSNFFSSAQSQNVDILHSPSDSDISSTASSINDGGEDDLEMHILSMRRAALQSQQTVPNGVIISPTADRVSENRAATVPQFPRHSGTVHLWHFIRELLDHPKQYGSCVRWVDREEGTFKIESSHHLARFWGQRKNRAQMNYDKLSRSLRQYYKKGIIQKPEKKQRLVYKFLPPYNL